ncbi:hypothetical protein ACTSKR_07320 [Chitinibacteraceae bacterium HSL-7]
MNVQLRLHCVVNHQTHSESIEWQSHDDDAGDSLNEALCRQTLVHVLDALAKRTAVPLEDRPVEFGFELLTHDSGGEHTWDEQAFFDEAAQWDALSQQLLTYSAACAHGAWNDRIWSDCETPAGTHAMNALMMKDRKWIPAYIDFLTSCDLDHEVDQAGDLDLAIERYGWQADTCTLAVARLVSCAGQFGAEQFDQWIERDLGHHLASDDGAVQLADAFHAELGRDTAIIGYLRQQTPDRQLEEINEWLSHLAPVLDDEQLAALRLSMMARFDAAAV